MNNDTIIAALAESFGEILRQWLTPDEFAEMKHRNESDPAYAGKACASHDFCDANMAMAADGFRSAEQFATVAHAARNTEVPFMVLKHRVLNEGKSLAQAIRESKPAIDAANEASQARAQARSDIAAIAG